MPDEHQTPDPKSREPGSAIAAGYNKLRAQGYTDDEVSKILVAREATERPTLGNYIDAYKVFRQYVMDESNLISARVQWIITINGFVFASVGLILQKRLGGVFACASAISCKRTDRECHPPHMVKGCHSKVRKQEPSI